MVRGTSQKIHSTVLSTLFSSTFYIGNCSQGPNIAVAGGSPGRGRPGL
jgi:hypothetical protein